MLKYFKRVGDEKPITPLPLQRPPRSTNVLVDETKLTVVNDKDGESQSDIANSPLAVNSSGPIISVPSAVLEIVPPVAPSASNITNILTQVSPTFVPAPCEPERASVSMTTSSYESVRLENIQRNQQFLMNLGLLAPTGNQLLSGPTKGSNGTKPSSKRSAKAMSDRTVEQQQLLPRRIQPRRSVNGGSAISMHNDGIQLESVTVISATTATSSPLQEHEVEVTYDSSAVLQYVLSTHGSNSNSSSNSNSTSRDVDNFSSYIGPIDSNIDGAGPDPIDSSNNLTKPVKLTIRGSSVEKSNRHVDGDNNQKLAVPVIIDSERDATAAASSSTSAGELWCADLAAVYSVHSHPHHFNLVAAAGKGGQVAVFTTTTTGERKVYQQTPTEIPGRIETEPLLLTFRGHDRWISSVRFLGSDSHSNSNNSGSSGNSYHGADDSDTCSGSSAAGSSAILLATAADDGKVKIWDISLATNSCSDGDDGGGGGGTNGSRVSGGKSTTPPTPRQQPKMLCWSHCGHSGKGIFAMDAQRQNILTGSKDKTVSYSVLDSGGKGLHTVSSYALHSGVVKSVSWKTSSPNSLCGPIFASGSQDGSVAIKDTRIGGNFSGINASISTSASALVGSSATAVTTTGCEMFIDSAHFGGVHTVQWCPYAASHHCLLTAGYDNMVRVYDTRMIGKGSITTSDSSNDSCVCSNSGVVTEADKSISDNYNGDDSNEIPQCIFHCSDHVLTGIGSGMSTGTAIKRSKDIFTPSFLNASAVVVPSVKSSSLSVYNFMTGAVLSRGIMQDAPVAVYCSSQTLQRTTVSVASPKCIVASTKSNGAMFVMEVV